MVFGVESNAGFFFERFFIEPVPGFVDVGEIGYD